MMNESDILETLSVALPELEHTFYFPESLNKAIKRYKWSLMWACQADESFLLGNQYGGYALFHKSKLVTVKASFPDPVVLGE